MQIFRRNLPLTRNGKWHRDFAGEPAITPCGYFASGPHAAVTVDTQDRRRIELFFTREEVEKMLVSLDTRAKTPD